jgi:hypothetical protein
MAGMQLSDWLSIIGIIMSTLMSVISIAVALHVYRKERKEQESKWQAERQAQPQVAYLHEETIGFFRWLLDSVKELLEVVFEAAKDMISRQPTQPREVQEESPTSSGKKDSQADQKGQQSPVREPADTLENQPTNIKVEEVAVELITVKPCTADRLHKPMSRVGRGGDEEFFVDPSDTKIQRIPHAPGVWQVSPDVGHHTDPCIDVE